MNVLSLMAAGVIVCVLAVGTRVGDEKDYPRLVVGKWKVVKASPSTFPLGTVLDLSKDDKAKVVGNRDGKEFIHAGTYEMDGARIIITVRVEGQEQKHTLTVTKISDTDMVTDHGGGGTIEFKKDNCCASGDASPAVPAKLPELPAAPSPETTRKLFPGFTEHDVRTTGAIIRALKGGKGPPLLLIHGHPETHVAWHKVAPALAADFTVVLPDLRGYGDSSKPPGGERSVNYSPRVMARDMVEVMKHFGFDRFAVAGHDRGGRVAHRLALDHSERVTRLAVLDIAPTLTMYRETNQEFATKYVWWFFQIQPAPLPEHLIGLDPAFYLKEHLAVQNKTPGAVTKEAMAEYLRCYCCTATIHAACEDYRAAAGVGLELDAADEKAEKKVTAPLLALWGAKGVVGKMWDVRKTWRAVATNVSGKALDCGHLLPEEQPHQVIVELRRFFRD